MNRNIPYGRQNLDAGDIESVVDILRSPMITQGPKIEEFEAALARHCQCEHAVAFNSGTAALHAAYFAAGLDRDDEFIVPANTFAATANAGLYLGASPVFCDSEPDTGNMDVGILDKLFTSRTRLVVPVHYAGHPVDMEPLAEMAARHGALVIEDACHALGASYRGTRIGNCAYSEMSVLSFHPVKHITTGEGGAVLTNKAAYVSKLKAFRSHGVYRDSFTEESHGPWYYEMRDLGYNYRITDMAAALGLSQLGKLDRFVDQRREVASKYARAFENCPFFELPPERPWARSAYHLYHIRLNQGPLERKPQVFTDLREAGIGVQVHYIPVYLHPYYRNLGFKKGLCPRAEEFYQRVLSIPIFPGLADDEFDRVIETILEAMRGELDL